MINSLLVEEKAIFQRVEIIMDAGSYLVGRCGRRSHALIKVLFFALDNIYSRRGSIPVIIVIVVPGHAPVISVHVGIPENIDLISQILILVCLVEIYVLSQMGHDLGQLLVLLLGCEPAILEQ